MSDEPSGSVPFAVGDPSVTRALTRGVLVHEWISQIGGSEAVLREIAAALPDADILCLWNDAQGAFPDRVLRETWLARTPLRRNKILALPAAPVVWRWQRDHDYDWAVVSTHQFSHHVRFRGSAQGVPKFLYVHTPARYIWSADQDGRGRSGVVRLASSLVKPLDRRRAQEAEALACNSKYIWGRIAECWGREAEVVYPPVDVENLQGRSWTDELTDRERTSFAMLPSEFLLAASRLVEYKRVDSAVRCAAASGLPLVVVGTGPEQDALARQARDQQVPIHFLGRVSDPFRNVLYARAVAYVFPAVEDFGIMPVEAMALGTPVVANRVGGAAETVADSRTGVLEDFRSRASMQAAVDAASRCDPGACRDRARDFSVAVFRENFLAWLQPRIQHTRILR